MSASARTLVESVWVEGIRMNSVHFPGSLPYVITVPLNTHYTQTFAHSHARRRCPCSQRVSLHRLHHMANDTRLLCLIKLLSSPISSSRALLTGMKTDRETRVSHFLATTAEERPAQPTSAGQRQLQHNCLCTPSFSRERTCRPGWRTRDCPFEWSACTSR